MVDIDKLAAQVGELTGLESKVMPGSQVWLFTEDRREVHAWPSGEWLVQEWGGEGDAPVPIGASCVTGQLENSEDVDGVARAIADCVRTILGS